VPKNATLIDVGGGASTLVDDLLDDGYTDVTVLDLSSEALNQAQRRLGRRSDLVTWIRRDILDADLPKRRFDVWHDRAVFHFLTEEQDRKKYVDAVLRDVKPGAFVIVATFSEEGPERCSGLPVRRYRADELHAEFGAPFTLLSHVRETHVTPSGHDQKFVYCFCRADGNG